MLQRWDGKVLFAAMVILSIGALATVDRIYFKRNHSFSVRFLYSSLPSNPDWDLPPPTQQEETILDEVLKQKFHYLAKGCHTYAFLSEDGKYVIKFHRYASHMRIFSWINHPFSYHFKERRKKIKEHNMRRLQANMLSYREAYQNLKRESGLLFLHINRSQNLHRTITLIDTTRAEYKVSLDEVTFILQHKAELIFPTLEKLMREKKLDEAKKVVSDLIHLMSACCRKGYVDEDPALHKNYGLLADEAIHIDLGDLVKSEQISLRENTISYVKQQTHSLCIYLQNQCPELLSHYNQEIEAL
ncbi:MAG: hypothetical protein JSS60_09095 [Verrucomicrobia bacterium]|nr:hypothetical protein [Verrucomicrobiota bacterium]